MSYTLHFAFGATAGATIHAQRMTTAVTVTDGAAITTGVTEIGNNGHYGYVGTFANSFEGFIKFYTSGDTDDILAFFAVTPREVSPVDAVMESGAAANSQTMLEQWRIIVAALAGLSNDNLGAGWAARDLANSKDRIASTLDSNGLRTAATLDGS